MFLKFNIENNMGTIAEPITNLKYNSLNDFRITFTQLDNEQEVFEEAVALLEQFEHQAVVGESQFKLIKVLIDKLILNHEMRLECDIRLRALKTKHTLSTVPKDKDFTLDEVFHIVNTSYKISELEEALISLKIPEYINIGKDGRELINVRISNIHSTFTNKEELLNTINEEVELIKTQLANLNSVENVDQLIGLMKVLNIQRIEDHPDIIKMVFKTIIARNKPFTTIGQVKQIIQEIRNNIDIVSDTISVDISNRPIQKLTI